MCFFHCRRRCLESEVALVVWSSDADDHWASGQQPIDMLALYGKHRFIYHCSSYQHVLIFFYKSIARHVCLSLHFGFWLCHCSCPLFILSLWVTCPDPPSLPTLPLVILTFTLCLSEPVTLPPPPLPSCFHHVFVFLQRLALIAPMIPLGLFALSVLQQPHCLPPLHPSIHLHPFAN